MGQESKQLRWVFRLVSYKAAIKGLTVLCSHLEAGLGKNACLGSFSFLEDLISFLFFGYRIEREPGFLLALNRRVS